MAKRRRDDAADRPRDLSPRKLPLTIPDILSWAESFHVRSGSWPKLYSGDVPERAGMTWRRIDDALRHGRHGLPGGSSLADLLARERGVRHRRRLPDLTEADVATWVRAHRRATGKRPTQDSGPVDGQPGETWAGVNAALRDGGRGLTGGRSLARFLAGLGDPEEPPAGAT